jgi:adenylate cyclase class IV
MKNELRRNVEKKYRCDDLSIVAKRAEELGAEPAGVLRQEDHFFDAPLGRLKLRDFGDGRGELIGYARPNRSEARTARYLIYPTEQPLELVSVLRFALGYRGVVRKSRTLYLHRNTRIHLDSVEGLGTFVELETVLTTLNETQGQSELRELERALELDATQAVPQAYIDLIERSAAER